LLFSLNRRARERENEESVRALSDAVYVTNDAAACCYGERILCCWRLRSSPHRHRIS